MLWWPPNLTDTIYTKQVVMIASPPVTQSHQVASYIDVLCYKLHWEIWIKYISLVPRKLECIVGDFSPSLAQDGWTPAAQQCLNFFQQLLAWIWGSRMNPAHPLLEKPLKRSLHRSSRSLRFTWWLWLRERRRLRPLILLYLFIHLLLCEA